jgi:leader peptidase (prepilin peptidase)/N-methyltransferase
MLATWPMLVALGLGFFLIGAVVGSFLNVCIYRIPMEKSVIWPGSHCPRCWSAIAPQDNIPIVSWLALRGECRRCGEGIAARYAMIETLMGLLFVSAFVIDVAAAARGPWWVVPTDGLIAATYHAIFLSLLVAATFIDYDVWQIPDEITVTGMVVGLAMGTIWPGIRPAPSAASSHLQGFLVGLTGLLVGAGLTQAVRVTAGFVVSFYRDTGEAMGLGDVTLMGMIGAFLGWQAAVLTFFIGPFFGLAHAGWKILNLARKWLAGDQSSTSDHEMPYGPYLSMAAATLFFTWPLVWGGWASSLFRMLYVIFWWGFGVNVPD